MDLGDLALGDFAPLVGSTVGVEIEPGTATTFEVMDASRPPGRPYGRDFSVLFRGPAELPLPQGTYLIDLGALGRQPLFLVPVESGGAGVVYEAVFTRMEPA